MTEQLRIADIARLRGCTPAQIGTWRSQSAPGKRLADHPFPAPDSQDGRSPLWNADRADELEAWEPTPAGGSLPPTLAEPQSPQVGERIIDTATGIVSVWDGDEWIEARPAPDPAAAAREQQRPRRHY